jgi:sugar-phosphatase
VPSRPPEPALIFDLDGVLVDTRAFVLGGWQRVAALLGRTIGDDEIRERLDGRQTMEVLGDVFNVHGDDARAVAVLLEDRTAEVDAAHPLPSIPGAIDFVTAARDGRWRLGLVSSASAANVRLALVTIGIEGAFEVVVDGGMTPVGKPSPEPYRVAASRMEIEPGGMIVFEDSRAGLASARAAGARCVAVAATWPAGRALSADLVLSDFVGWTPERVVASLGPRATPVANP